MKNSIINNRLFKQSLLVLITMLVPAITFAAPAVQGNEWSISSNAGSSQLLIRAAAAKSAKVTIADHTGNVIYTGELKKNANTINVQEMNEGQYTISIQDGAGTKVYKLKVL